jgi:hypothetical protein
MRSRVRARWPSASRYSRSAASSSLTSGQGAELAGVEGGEQFLPGGLGGGVVADPVEQVTGQLLGSGADGAAAAASDERSPAG